ncbi:MAG: D-aminoacyl-tRNA deacylase [bacterium]|nr:D-aminoacyl-tRNA deacylase [bacterium]
MRVVVQRVKDASVRVDGDEVSQIDKGLLVLVAFSRTDAENVVTWIANKIVGLRIFSDTDDRMNLDLETVGGDILVVSQFTLYGDVTKGRRPSFENSASADDAEVLYDFFIETLQGIAPGKVLTGAYQAHMEVGFVNDGPVTILIDKEEE